MLNANEIIKLLQLEPLPKEGGYYREIYRSKLTIPLEALPKTYEGSRQASTAIYYLLTPDTFSALHRLPSDEIFHFYLGDPVEMLQLHPDGTGEIIKISNDLNDTRPQVLAPAGSWQGSRLVTGGNFALMGVTVAPGFEFIDYTSAEEDLILQYPNFSELIKKLI